MAASLVFVDADPIRAERVAEPFSQDGWVIEVATPTENDATDRIVEKAPVAAVFCLDSEFDRQIAIAGELVQDERIARPLIVFTGGTPEESQRAREAVPFGAIVSPEELGWVLRHLVPRS
jgi:AmiR/NasT family two-component response regulator